MVCLKEPLPNASLIYWTLAISEYFSWGAGTKDIIIDTWFKVLWFMIPKCLIFVVIDSQAMSSFPIFVISLFEKIIAVQWTCVNVIMLVAEYVLHS